MTLIFLSAYLLLFALTQNGIAANMMSIDRPMTNHFQPNVITVESYPSRKVFGSLSDPMGSHWCDGNVTYWMVGHQPNDESPWCLSTLAVSTILPETNETFIDYSNSAWKQPFLATLDKIDRRNAMDGDKRIDRHDCVKVDANYDGLDDIICGVGANKGKGEGFNELYLGTNHSGSSNRLAKVGRARGLQKHSTTRTRFVKTLKSADGSDLVFIAARGAPRSDGETNVHRMYRNVIPKRPSPKRSFYYSEVKGPWREHTRASCLITQDLNGDGLDDILICNQRAHVLVFFQNADTTWTTLPTKLHDITRYWRSARVADFTGDGVLDLVVVGWGASPAIPNELSYVRIFQGQSTFPYFDFKREPILDTPLHFATPDVEVLDVNSDGSPDIYIPLADELTLDTYCADVFDNRLWWKKGNQPPSNWTPPIDPVADLLILGKTSDGTYAAEQSISMDHAEPGCGWMVERFGNGRTMILAQGTGNRPGHNLILQWL